jgi:hypothetical protein
MNVLRHWLEAEELPRCQHCPALADERSFMCEDCAGEADAEVDTLRDQLAGAVAVADVEQLLSDTSRYFAGDHLNAGVVLGEVRKRLRALAGGQ